MSKEVKFGPLPLPNGGQVTVVVRDGEPEITCHHCMLEDVPQRLVDRLIEYAEAEEATDEPE